MATRKRSRRRSNRRMPRRGALRALRAGFRRAANARGPAPQLAWLFWGLLGILFLLFVWSFVRP